MNPQAVKLASERLSKAERALLRLESADKFVAAEEAWADFLLAINSIYSKLEQGAKVNGKSLSWFGRKKNERRKDPLLRYLHFARNSDEHGIEKITENHVSGSIGDIRPKFNERHRITIHKVDQTTWEPTGERSKGIFPGSHIKCVRVFDSRFGDHCDPPLDHFGDPILIPENPEISGAEYPDVLAETALPYLRRMIDEAKSLICG